MATPKGRIKGILYPYQKLGNGIPASSQGVDVYVSALLSLLRTNQRARVNRPTLGTKILYYVFETSGPLLRNFLIQEITTVVGREIPQISILNIDIKEEQTKVTVNILFTVQGLQMQTGNITYSRVS